MSGWRAFSSGGKCRDASDNRSVKRSTSAWRSRFSASSSTEEKRSEDFDTVSRYPGTEAWQEVLPDQHVRWCAQPLFESRPDARVVDQAEIDAILQFDDQIDIASRFVGTACQRAEQGGTRNATGLEFAFVRSDSLNDGLAIHVAIIAVDHRSGKVEPLFVQPMVWSAPLGAASILAQVFENTLETSFSCMRRNLQDDYGIGPICERHCREAASEPCNLASGAQIMHSVCRRGTDDRA